MIKIVWFEWEFILILKFYFFWLIALLHCRSAAAALMMGENIPRFNRCQPERHDFSAMGLGGMINPGSRQIYLTFPADSTFREEDVSNYFR